jgi:acyl transferase domain-containing protein
MIKTILSLEKGMIPGNPTFITPNPKIDFDALRIRPSRHMTRWPSVSLRRASVNSFGYGGSNAHVVIDEAKGMDQNFVSSYLAEEVDDLFAEETSSTNPYLLVFSANDEPSLKNQISALDKHLSDPAVSIQLRDLAYTLSERRSRHYHRGFVISRGTKLDIQSFTYGRANPETPKIGFIFTGQGAQWPEMGKQLLQSFPVAARQIKYLDQVLKGIPDPPVWTLFGEYFCGLS